MAIKLIPGPSTGETIPGVDRHYYENQLPASSAFDDTYAFRLAAARAKDEARHRLIKAVRKAKDDADFNRSKLSEAGSFLSGERITWQRSIDGVEGAPDDDIVL